MIYIYVGKKKKERKRKDAGNGTNARKEEAKRNQEGRQERERKGKKKTWSIPFLKLTYPLNNDGPVFLGTFVHFRWSNFWKKSKSCRNCRIKQLAGFENSKENGFVCFSMDVTVFLLGARRSKFFWGAKSIFLHPWNHRVACSSWTSAVFSFTSTGRSEDLGSWRFSFCNTVDGSEIWLTTWKITGSKLPTSTGERRISEPSTVWTDFFSKRFWWQLAMLCVFF